MSWATCVSGSLDSSVVKDLELIPTISPYTIQLGKFFIDQSLNPLLDTSRGISDGSSSAIVMHRFEKRDGMETTSELGASILHRKLCIPRFLSFQVEGQGHCTLLPPVL